MSHLVYLAILIGCLVAPVVLELTLRVHVARRWRRLALTLLPVVVIFTGWDALSVRAGQWSYARRFVTGVRLPGGLPVEEVLFFVVIPVCAVATLEAVRRVRPGWKIGDEP
jgi:lycopene cyclase domain-containing protein